MQTRREHLASLLGLGTTAVSCSHLGGVISGSERERRNFIEIYL